MILLLLLLVFILPFLVQDAHGTKHAKKPDLLFCNTKFIFKTIKNYRIIFS